jgi:hypothetical protein
MNYFAHARLAASRRKDPRFALGAMLPDWLGWIGDRPRRVTDAALAGGIRFHHESDAAFHAGRRFLALVRESTAALQSAGVGRGPARGVAHVGIELLLDGVLAERDPASCFYAEALDAAPGVSPHVRWGRDASADRFTHAARRLAEDGPPRRFSDPPQLARAVARTLERRPRLRVPAEVLPAVEHWAHTAHDEVRRDATTLLAETEARLSARAFA